MKPLIIIKKNCLRRYFHARDILRRAGTVLTAPPAKGFCEAKDRAQAGRGSAVFWRNLAGKENLPLKKNLGALKNEKKIKNCKNTLDR